MQRKTKSWLKNQLFFCKSVMLIYMFINAIIYKYNMVRRIKTENLVERMM